MQISVFLDMAWKYHLTCFLLMNEKPLWGVANKVCMFVCTLIRELLCVFPYNFCQLFEF